MVLFGKEMITKGEAPIVGLRMSVRAGSSLKLNAHNLRWESSITLGPDIRDHVVIEGNFVVVREDQVGLEVPQLRRQSISTA